MALIYGQLTCYLLQISTNVQILCVSLFIAVAIHIGLYVHWQLRRQIKLSEKWYCHRSITHLLLMAQ